MIAVCRCCYLLFKLVDENTNFEYVLVVDGMAYVSDIIVVFFLLVLGGYSILLVLCDSQ